MTDKTPWLNPGSWHASPTYWDKEALELRKRMTATPRFIDCTLPEGDDCVGYQLNWNTRLELMRRLDAVGVHAITLHSHGTFSEEADLAKAFRRAGLKAQLVGKGPGIHFPMKKSHDWRTMVERVVAMDVDVICPEFVQSYGETVSDYTTGALTKTEMTEGIQEVMEYLQQFHLKVVPWHVDSFRSPTGTVVEMVQAMVRGGAAGVYLSDSRGNSHPLATRVLVRTVRDAIGPDIDIYCHHHNDLGVATANALASLEGGSNWVDCTVIGIGDRGGTVSLEETACLLEMYGTKTGIDLSALNDLCSFARDAFGVTLSPWKAIVGKSWNMEEGSGHLQGGGSSDASFGLAPEVVGRKMELVIGGKILFGRERSSASTDDPFILRDMIRERGVVVDEAQFQTILHRARAAVATTRDRFYLTTDEFQGIVDGVVGGQPSRH